MRVYPPGPVGEQAHRLRLAGLGWPIGPGYRQRRQPVSGLPGHLEWFPAGGQDQHVVRGGQQHLAQIGCGRDDLLAVVQYQQHLLAGERRDQRFCGRKARGLGYPERRGHRGGL